MKKTYEKVIGLIVIFILGYQCGFSQNLFPTAKGSNIKIDGGGVDIIYPVTTGGWARGISFFQSSGADRLMEMGLTGVANSLSHFYLAYGAAPWASGIGLYILPDGKVGIGTISPQASLSVNGNILAKEIKIKTDITVPDYVFEPDYKLLSLPALEKFVNKHKHLPEIPSATAIAEHGLDLAEMNLALLKKVEELTLHLIEKDKEIKHHQERLTDVELRLGEVLKLLNQRSSM